MVREVTLLLVEDDESMLEGMADLLEGALYSEGLDVTILQAGNGKIALEKMQDQWPDLIVSDIMMPEMGGYEFLEQVRLNPAWKSIPFVFLSAKGDTVDIRTGQLSDADLYLTKPFVSRDLVQLIKKQLDRAFERRSHSEQQIDTFKKTILQTLNHEFRTPLTYVTAYYDLLASSIDYASSDNYQEYLRGIQAGCQRLTRLIEDFIVVMELRSGKTESFFLENATSIENINIPIQNAIDRKRPLADERQITVRFTPCEQPPVVWGVPHLIQNGIERILDNAIKFTAILKEPATIEVTAVADEQQISIHVVDIGPGIPDAMHQQVFDLFVQYNRDQIEQQGAGIGLTIAQGLFALHNGEIYIENNQPSGTAVIATIPTSKPTLSAGATLPGNPRNVTILLVEDDINLLEGLADLMAIEESKYNFNILTAVNGLVALEQMQETTPDIILSDIMMPKMDGYEFLKAVRDNPQWLNIPFIFVTAKGERRDEFDAYKLGVEEYIKKPYESDDVIRLVEKQLDKYFHLREQVSQDFESLKRNILQLISPDFMLPLDLVREHSDRLSTEMGHIDTESELTESLRGIQSGSELLNKIVEDFIALAELETDEAKTAYDMQSQPIANFGFLIFELVQAIKYNQPIDVTYSLNDSLPLLYGNSDLLINCLERAISLCTIQIKKVIITSEHVIDENVVKIQVINPNPLSLKQWSEIESILQNGTAPSQISLQQHVPNLLIIKGYIDLHQGNVKLENNTQSGCTFTFMLPVYTMPDDMEG